MLAGKAGDYEDAAVVRFPDGRALVQTLDFFTPMVNDPFGFGRIAAANALSDIYAMGGEPLAAMNILCFPCKDIPIEVLREILEGGLDAVREAGAVPAGGHSVEDDGIKYGLAVSGTVDPKQMATNRGVNPGDLLVLTKAVGTGVLATALKAEWTGHENFEKTLIKLCGRLNNHAGWVISELSLTGATDITGFGLGGHLLELAQASDVSLELKLSAVPFLPEALALAGVGFLPGGSIKNREHYLPQCHVPGSADPLQISLTFDAQTSGGLVLAVPESKLAVVTSMLTDAGDLAEVIGRATKTRGDGRRLAII